MEKFTRITHKLVAALRLLKCTITSDLYDWKWIAKQRPNEKRNPWSIFQLLRHSRERISTCHDFNVPEYLMLNPDVAAAGAPPLRHYLRWGRYQQRQTSILEDEIEPKFPEGSQEMERKFPASEAGYNRVCVFSSYSGNGKIHQYVLEYLKGLKEICDQIIFVCDAPLFPEELDKLDGLVVVAKTVRHGQYDFRSYAIGIDCYRKSGHWDEIKELVVCNDSCYGPFIPFQEQFSIMSGRDCDFWGQTRLKNSRMFIQSYFFVFRNSLLRSKEFAEFWNACFIDLPAPIRVNTVWRREMEMTDFFRNAGFREDSWVPLVEGVNMSYCSARSLRKYRMPLVKIKCYGDVIKNYDSYESIMAAMKEANPELAAVAIPHFEAKREWQKKLNRKEIFHVPSIKDHQASFKEKVARLRERASSGEKIRALFIVANASMFSSRNIFEILKDDSAFDAKILVTPYPQHPNDRSSLDVLVAEYGEKYVMFARSDDFYSTWREPDKIADLVFYNSPYDAVHPFYSLRHAIGHHYLPVMASYGYPRSEYDNRLFEMDSYAICWKLLLENDQNFEEYKQHSVIGGTNGVVTGYVKMDDYAHVVRRRRSERKCVLLAPHHTIPGGFNDFLALSNFLDYAEALLDLPKKYPNVDFIFRPHPALFTAIKSRKIWSEEKIEQWKTRLLANENLQWSTTDNYLQDFADSDAMIDDCGSFLVDYFYTGKPQCYLLKSRKDIKRKFTPFGRDCLTHCTLGYNEADIMRFIDDVVVRGDDPMKEARERFAKERVMINYPNASKVAIEHIKQDLDLL